MRLDAVIFILLSFRESPLDYDGYRIALPRRSLQVMALLPSFVAVGYNVPGGEKKRLRQKAEIQVRLETEEVYRFSGLPKAA